MIHRGKPTCLLKVIRESNQKYKLKLSQIIIKTDLEIGGDSGEISEITTDSIIDEVEEKTEAELVNNKCPLRPSFPNRSNLQTDK